MSVLIQMRRDLAANWVSVNPILSQGEMGIEIDTNRFKFGNGSDAWNDIDYPPVGNILYENVVSASNLTTTSDTLANVTNMVFPIGANEIWTFEMDIQNGCNNTGGLKYALTTPSGSSFRAQTYGTSAGIANLTSAVLSVSGTEVGNAYNTVNSQGGWTRVVGSVFNGATPGNVQLQWRVVTAGQTGTIYGASRILAKKIS
jgi:hypothetical protein